MFCCGHCSENLGSSQKLSEHMFVHTGVLCNGNLNLGGNETTCPTQTAELVQYRCCKCETKFNRVTPLQPGTGTVPKCSNCLGKDNNYGESMRSPVFEAENLPEGADTCTTLAQRSSVINTSRPNAPKQTGVVKGLCNLETPLSELHKQVSVSCHCGKSHSKLEVNSVQFKVCSSPPVPYISASILKTTVQGRTCLLEDDTHCMTKARPAKKQLFSCKLCKKRFNRSGHLTRHMRTHTGVKPYQCKVCNKKFNGSGDLTRHMRTHTGVKPYQCTVCYEKFSVNGHLTAHMRTHTGVKSYQCTVCYKKFSERRNFTKHMRTHTGIKPYQCTVCNKHFTRSGNLTVHMRTHTRVKPYQCTVCNKKFRERGGLTVHMRTHTGVKPYQCTVCNKQFSERGNFTRHMRTHTGVKPYQCTVCNKYFTRSGNLTVHIRTHTGVKPYQCTVCNKKFSQSGSLTKHMSTHTGVKP